MRYEHEADFVSVNKHEFEKLKEVTAALIEQKHQLQAANDELKADLRAVVTSLGGLGEMIGGGSLNVSTIMKIMQKKESLADQVKPLAAVLQKYSVVAAVAE